MDLTSHVSNTSVALSFHIIYLVSIIIYRILYEALISLVAVACSVLIACDEKGDRRLVPHRSKSVVELRWGYRGPWPPIACKLFIT